MSLPIDQEEIKKLKAFIDFATANPAILNMPQLEFVKTFIEHFGGTVPAGDFKMPSFGSCPFGGGAAKADAQKQPDPMSDEQSDEEPEGTELELDMEGVIEGDNNPPPPMGDSKKQPTEEEIDLANELRCKAAAAYADGNFQAAIEEYGKAIELNPGSALFHAKRGQVFLKLKQPNACILDCDKALELNSDLAAAYKYRGRAHRLLGNWELSAKDLRQACKLDYDEEAGDWLAEVTPNATKIEQHRIKQERKKLEKETKEREKRMHKAQEANKKAREERQKEPGMTADFLSYMSDPEVAAALEDIVSNPANIVKYAGNPKIMKLVDMIKNKSGGIPNFGGMGGMPGGMGGGFPGGFSGGPKGAAPPNKPDLADDGLD